MTFHHSRLLEGRKVELKSRVRLGRSVLNGGFSLTLNPKSPCIELGSIEGDWKAVGNDIREAMKPYETCD